MEAFELKTFLDEIYEATGETHDCDFQVSIILNHCIDDFSNNIYVLDYNEKNRIVRENTCSLHKEENEEAIVPSKLGKEWDFPPSPPTCDDNFKTKYSLDDDLFLLENPPCLEDTMLCEDKNDKLFVYDNSLIHENSMLLLKFPIYTIEEKYGHVEKYLYGFQLSYAYGKSSCSHDIMMKSSTNNYFERGKHDY
jgi:hypothetical protein